MADITEDDQRRANTFYLTLNDQIKKPCLERMKAYAQNSPITPAELEKCDSFTKLCEGLTRMRKISPEKNCYLMEMFRTVGREDLRILVVSFDRKMKQSADPSIPLTCLYNQKQILPISERLKEFHSVLERFLHDHPNVIPQQLFYINAAAGIARPDRVVTLRLGEDEFSMSIQKGAVTEKKIIYCHFAEGLRNFLQAPTKNIVYYSIPVLLGPPGEVFEKQVFLEMTHNAAPTDFVEDDRQFKFFFRDSDGEPEWKEGGEHFCKIKPGNPKATILLDHFTEVVIGVDARTTSSLPPLRARLMTCVTCISDTERCLLFCLLFDSPYMIQKAKQLIREKEGTMLDVTSQEIILEPRVSCKVQIGDRRWITRDQVEDVTLDELDMLVFNPISREIAMIQEENADIQDSIMCNIVITQNTQTQEFAVSDDTLKLSKPADDEVSNSPEYTDARPDCVGLGNGLVPSETIVRSFLAELDRQRMEFKKYVDAMQGNHKEQSMTSINVMQESHEKQIMTLMGTMKDFLQQQRTDHQKQIDNLLEKHQQQTEHYQKQVNELHGDFLQQKTEYQKQIDVVQENLQQQNTGHQKMMDVLQENLQELRDTLHEALQQQKERQTQIDSLGEDFQQQKAEHQEEIHKLQAALQQQKSVHYEDVDKLQAELQLQKSVHREEMGKFQVALQQQETVHQEEIDKMQAALKQQKTDHQKQIDSLQGKFNGLCFVSLNYVHVRSNKYSDMVIQRNS